MEENDKIKEQIKAEHDTKIKSLFIQFSTYFKFQSKINVLLNGSSFIKYEDTFNIIIIDESEIKGKIKKIENRYIQSMFCLIDKDWIN